MESTGERRPLLTRLPLLLAAVALAYAALGGLLFALAGRTDLPWMWAALGAVCASHLGIVLVLRRDPDLIAERLRPGPGVPTWDRVVGAVGGALALAALVAAALDVGRWHRSDTVPVAARAAGLAGIVLGIAFVAWAMATNTFFSRLVRIQSERGHRVVTGGPYRFVRHPGYVGWTLLSVGCLLALGSWIGVGIGLLETALIVYRTVREDRFLHERLEGYADYAARVRWRLLPGLF